LQLQNNFYPGMTIEEKLRERSGSQCELCASAEMLRVYDVPPYVNDADKSILVCQVCFAQINGAQEHNIDHWRCLNNSMWSSVPAVQVTVWRLLNKLKGNGWPADLLDMLYLDEDVLQWAKMAPVDEHSIEEKVIHKDSNGAVLQAGDTVVLIKDLEVKGGGFTAKRGTAVKGISLVEDNSSQIEGRINGQQIVILTQYVKKSS
jgi:protein PhnA